MQRPSTAIVSNKKKGHNSRPSLISNFNTNSRREAGGLQRVGSAIDNKYTADTSKSRMLDTVKGSSQLYLESDKLQLFKIPWTSARQTLTLKLTTETYLEAMQCTICHLTHQKRHSRQRCLSLQDQWQCNPRMSQCSIWLSNVSSKRWLKSKITSKMQLLALWGAPAAPETTIKARLIETNKNLKI